MSNIVRGFVDTNLDNTHAAVEMRPPKTNKSPLEFISSNHRHCVSLGLAWGEALVFCFVF